MGDGFFLTHLIYYIYYRSLVFGYKVYMICLVRGSMKKTIFSRYIFFYERIDTQSLEPWTAEY